MGQGHFVSRTLFLWRNWVGFFVPLLCFDFDVVARGVYISTSAGFKGVNIVVWWLRLSPGLVDLAIVHLEL